VSAAAIGAAVLSALLLRLVPESTPAALPPAPAGPPPAARAVPPADADPARAAPPDESRGASAKMPAEPLVSWVRRYGYLAVFSLLMLGIIGLPVPDETLLTLVGYLVSRGELKFLPTLAAAVAGSSLGITISGLIGRTLGVAVVRKYGRWLRVSEATLDRVRDWFARRGKWALLLGYYVPGARHVVAVVAGSARLPAATFAAFAYSGALVWATTFLTLGYYAAEDWRSVAEALRRHVLVGVVALGLAAGTAWLLRRRMRSSAS
jgi:membrane protein DedA with SNARE-associated domain